MKAWCASVGRPPATTAAARPTSAEARSPSRRGRTGGAARAVPRRVSQTPPAVSAKKVDGRRAYDLARKYIAVELAPVRSDVYELTLLECNGADARLRAHCSGGTYMRSIAHDLGQALGCGAHLPNLRRWPAANSRSTRRGPSRNWNRWPRATGWWTRSCRRRRCCRASPAWSWTTWAAAPQRNRHPAIAGADRQRRRQAFGRRCGEAK